jgi:hypothetical protein
MNMITLRGRMLALAVCACLGLSTAAFAQHGGGGVGGGGHGGGYGGHAGGYGGHADAYAGRGYGGYGGHGYGYGGWRGGYGYGGWRGGYGYGWRGGWGGWGWGWGLGYGAFLATLPLYYSTWWWDGVPYYANDNYYVWNPSANGYVVTTPPAQVTSQAGGVQGGAATGGAAPGAGTTVFAYPKNGQSTETQASDKYACHQWAAKQSGFDPTAAAPAAGNAQGQRQDYMRAQAACLEGRGYSVQ